jgi:pilus assembly protein CpaE
VDDKVSGFEAGVDDYLTKPTQPRELFAHVKAVLARSGKGRSTPSDTVKRDLGHVIGVLAAKGGLGVSTLATNLAISLRLRTQQNVTLAELRPGEGSMALELGYLQPEGLGRLLQKRASDITSENVETELVSHKSEIQILPASYRPSDARINLTDRMEAIARHLAYTANFVILDLGPGITPSTDKILEVCNELIVPLEPVSHIITRTQLLMDELIERGFGEGRLTAVLYTRSRSELNMALSNVQQQFKHPISLVFTAAPEAAFQAARSNIPMVLQQPDSLTSQQFLKLADLVTKHVRLKA